MAKAMKRDTMRVNAYEWCLANVAQFFERFNETLGDPGATAEYHAMVDGIVWSDELPSGHELDLAVLRQVFSILVYVRTSEILGETIPPSAIELMTRVRKACPNWSFNRQDRNASSRLPDYEDVRDRFFNEMEQMCQPFTPNERTRQ